MTKNDDSKRDAMSPTTVMVCGDQKWSDVGMIRDFLKTLPSRSSVICPGDGAAARIAATEGRDLGHVVETVDFAPARVLELSDFRGRIKKVAAFHDFIEGSFWTVAAVRAAKAQSIDIWLSSEEVGRSCPGRRRW